MKTEELIRNINYFIAKNGPDKEDYQALDNLMNLFGERIKDNAIDLAELSSLKQSCGFLHTTQSIMGHILQKPFGYAGDFSIIDRIYTRDSSSEYHKWDDYSLANSAAQAVRNRKKYFKDHVSSKLHQSVKLLNIASGPARDLYELYAENPGCQLSTTCVEMDKAAISHAQQLNKQYLNQIEFVNKNIFRFQTEDKYDIIWSAGLFDYFDDKAFVLLIKRFAGWLAPGGEIIIGNFNEDNNPSRCYMEIFGDWRLNHRTEEQLIDLAVAAGFSREDIFVGKEPENINLFLHLKKGVLSSGINTDNLGREYSRRGAAALAVAETV
ncbi:class I SAM-dependent methyltransferase [Hymenobacter cellulosilyticus]|uniref:Class I SAM-dependent methyltransferase n=1 Tax=Hymenobacter cellulosilyticus TaxID=2932248 RepID=A0A8T9Q6Z8_9BACT|nr:class I SAM-dependent methyltransferase [Hymenobacter cellulosilyticus]UOQ71550.1 class I SAM-dependent methyltransferase [Hymenobacter cellulosilyticus]